MKLFIIGLLTFFLLSLISAYIEKDNNHPYWQNIIKTFT